MSVERIIMPESECDRRDCRLLTQACDWLGIDVIWADRQSLDGIPPACPVHGTAVYGGTTFCRLAAKALGAKVLEPADDFLTRLPSKYVNRHVELMPLSTARSIKEPRFIKPVNDKFFPAAVYECGADVPETKHGDDILAIVAEPVKWAVEYRLFVLDRDIRTFSPYLWPEGSRPDEKVEREVLAFGNRVLADSAVECPRAVVLDIGVIEGVGWSVIEANTAVMSGIYDCEPEAVLGVLEAGLIAAGEHSDIQ